MSLKDKQIKAAHFLCVPGDSPSLLGRESASTLGVLKLDVNCVNENQDILDKYPGIQKIPDVLKIHQ